MVINVFTKIIVRKKEILLFLDPFWFQVCLFTVRVWTWRQSNIGLGSSSRAGAGLFLRANCYFGNFEVE